MSFCERYLRLYAVTDRRWVKSGGLIAQVEQAIDGGATMIQLREKDLPDDEFLHEAVLIGALCRRRHIPLIINDNIKVALAADADGVHIGQGDTPAREARRLIGAGKFLGVTAKTPEQAREAEFAGADYLGSGAVFGSNTKTDTAAMSYDTLKSICAAVDIPVVAIGGIDEGNILRLSGSGVRGAAVVSSLFAAEDIRSQAQRLRALSEQMVNGSV